MREILYKVTHLFTYATEDRNDASVKKRKSQAVTNICAIISILLFLYLLTGLN
ncbi:MULTISPECIES: hypothetical protein [unclassified Clostridium]|uniref:hypothetical protein n=1 Tax=unclassified Clostridium TaxID=2614128 RepID=UPI001896CF4C|nr:MULTISPECIES: hypothetical protein [unclassified Clostridium]MCR1950086.1 hypothetical protein [Clostridium sp. DSM 100503]